VLFLGGSIQQIPAIQYAKEQGYFTVLCDYYDDSPAQIYSDEFFCISTTDKESILKVAISSNINGIVAYASDPAAATAAFVGNQLNLPSNLYQSVKILSEKDLFRKFLHEHGFNSPNSIQVIGVEEAKAKIRGFTFPLMVKPTDSSGSKGITRIDSIEQIQEAVEIAMSNSRNNKVIIEEFIEMGHDYLIGGDIFVLNGKIRFTGYLNCHRNTSINPLVPIGKSYPVLIDNEKIELITEELQKVMDLLHIKSGAFNIEVMFDQNGNLYIIEIGPRNGGNFIPQLLRLITGVDLVRATVEAALDNQTLDLQYSPPSDAYYSTYILHTEKEGVLKEIVFLDAIKKYLVNKTIYKQPGEQVEKFTQANKAIGILFLKFSNRDEMIHIMKGMGQYIDIRLEDDFG